MHSHTMLALHSRGRRRSVASGSGRARSAARWFATCLAAPPWVPPTACFGLFANQQAQLSTPKQQPAAPVVAQPSKMATEQSYIMIKPGEGFALPLGRSTGGSGPGGESRRPPTERSAHGARGSSPCAPCCDAKGGEPPCAHAELAPFRPAPADGVQRGLVGEIIKRFEARGYTLRALKVCPDRVLRTWSKHRGSAAAARAPHSTAAAADAAGARARLRAALHRLAPPAATTTLTPLIRPSAPPPR